VGVSKLPSDFIADAEENLVWSLPLECGMRHHAIVLVHVELDESPQGREAFQGMKVEPRVFQ
jgi:hypothetical protein